MKLSIDTYCRISKDGVYQNGKPILTNNSGDDFSSYAKQIYKALDLSYPKFYKMDNLCKLAFLACEVLIGNKELGENAAIILGNKTSSRDTDKRHYASFKSRDNYFPSPAVFVYTLPNIMLGEICIRHKITGENSCFLMEGFDADFFNDYVRDLFINEGYKHCITGWVDFQPTKYEANLLLITESSNENAFTFNKENLKQLLQEL